MKKRLYFFVEIFSFLFLLLFILFKVEIKPDGDIVEYYGVSETILNHGSLDLRQEDIDNLLQFIDAPKFNNPGYYLYGRENNRYPVHFWAYSLLLIPARLLAQLAGFNPLLSLPITNLIIFYLTLWWIKKTFVKKNSQRLLLLSLLIFSPLAFYFTWPGPDMLYLSLLLIAVFYAFNKGYVAATWLSALASWHSQPLIVLTLFFGITAIYKNRQTTGLVLGAVMSAAIAYLYNLYAFNSLTPWIGLQNAYASLNGFGLQNLSLQKLFEQFFDLNIGLAWYAPVLLFLSALGVGHFIKHRQWQKLTVVLAFGFTAFFYQTNPAWHYGTTGYGPTRHSIFLLPLLVYLSLKYWPKSFSCRLWGILVLAVLIQGFSLFFNGFIYPDTTKTLFHTPYARYFLNNYPQLYNPTPEIFIDRTLHQDTMLPRTTVYTEEGICKKAYVLPNGEFLLKQICGFIPQNEKPKLKLLENLSQYKGVYVNY